MQSSKKNSIKKLVSLVGVVSASILLSFPSLAQTNSNASSLNQLINNSTRRANSPISIREFLAQSQLENRQSNSERGYSNNPTTGGGYKGDWLRLNNSRYSNGGIYRENRQSATGGADTGNRQYASDEGYSTNPTTGGGYKGDWLRLNNPNYSNKEN
jgi:hypothetical protein